MIIDIGTSFFDMTESEMQALDLNEMDLCRVRDDDSGWSTEHRSPALSPVLWFVPRNHLDAPRGCLPKDPFSEGEHLVSPYHSPDASPPADLPIRSAPMTDAFATPLSKASPSDSSDMQDGADADSLSTSPRYIEKAKVRLEYIDNALSVEEWYETCSSTGEREFWEMSRLAMRERIQSDRDWRECMEEGTYGYT